MSRHRLLAAVYEKWHKAPLNERSLIAASGECFNAYWKPFASRANHHAKISPLAVGPFPPFSRDKMARYVVRSCALEGIVANEEDLDTCAAARSHMLAFEVGLDMMKTRPFFYMTEPELLKLHAVLMNPFPASSPGKYRTWPVQIAGWDMACFPYPQEVPGLMKMYFKWLADPHTVHPYLRACDVFLTTVHLHPFQDGNGRLARLLSWLVVAQSGLEVPFRSCNLPTPRLQYHNAVYNAQHHGKVADFYAFELLPN
jgi:Fic family protein